METVTTLDTRTLEQKVKNIYTQVAQNPEGEYHFEMGRKLAERLGYSPRELDAIPAEAIQSFAGVGCFFLLESVKEDSTVVDLGSGSGMDSFLAANMVGPKGNVIGIDMTREQLRKARALGKRYGFRNTQFEEAYIERTPLSDATADVVISNGVINLSPYKRALFKEVARVLKPGGKLMLSDIVSSTELPESITCNSSLWAACIGGAIPKQEYISLIEQAGLQIAEVRENPEYAFISKSAQGATARYGVKSISVCAVR